MRILWMALGGIALFIASKYRTLAEVDYDITDLKFKSIAGGALKAELTFMVYNTSLTVIPLSEMFAVLYYGQNPIGAIKQHKTVNLAAKDTTVMKIPVDIRIQSGISFLVQALLTGNFQGISIRGSLKAGGVTLPILKQY